MRTLTAQDFGRIRVAARAVLDEQHVPGLSIGIVQGKDLVFSEGYGYADIESRAPMTPDRRQCIASITKTMVALCVMALVDEGRLRLTDRTVDLLPDVRFDGPAGTMTVWHLLTHTGGIGEAPTQDTLAATVNPDQDARRKPGEFADAYPDGITIEFEPGTKWHYANHGFQLLGEIVRRTEGTDLNDVMQRRIFGPLRMDDTDLRGEYHAALSTPYHRAPGEDRRFQLERAGVAIKDETAVDGHNIRGRFGGEFNKAALAAGGVQSSIPDMARYAAAILGRGAGIVREATFATMVAPQYCPDDRLVSWGLGFIREPFAGRRIIGHGGAYFGGWNSSLSVFPEDDLAVIQHMNVMLEDPAPVFDRVLRAVLDAPTPTFTERAVYASILETAPGIYELSPGRLTNFRPATSVGRIQIERNGDGLLLRSRWGHWKHGVRLTPCDPHDPALFAIQRPGAEPAYVALTRDDEGHVDGLRCDRLVRMHRREESDRRIEGAGKEHTT
jgi:CubicO group peptidase (beta-lactamase class C family)